MVKLGFVFFVLFFTKRERGEYPEAGRVRVLNQYSEGEGRQFGGR
jgi:hypothetical protein